MVTSKDTNPSFLELNEDLLRVSLVPIINKEGQTFCGW